MRHAPVSRFIAVVTVLALLAAIAPTGTVVAIGRAGALIHASGNVTVSESDTDPTTSPQPAPDGSPAPSTDPGPGTEQAPGTDPGTTQTLDPSPAPAGPTTLSTGTRPAGPAAWPFAWRGAIRSLGAGTNRLSAGGIKSLRFTLDGDRGLDILAPGYPVSQRYDCRTGRLIPLSRYRTRPHGLAGLSYDPATQRYTYAWQTREEWSNTCRIFTIKLIDGSTHAAAFRIDTFRFIAPTKRFPRFNNGRPGTTVPVAFHLGASATLDIFAGSTPRSREVDCATDAPLGAWETTTPAGTAGLTRNAARQDYRYAWQTDAAWTQTCRAFEMRMKDGTVQQLRFRFNRPPRAIDDSGTGFTTDQSAAFTTASILGNDVDPDSDPLTITAVDQAGLTGTLTDNADGTFDYDPGSSFDRLGEGESDTDSFGYTIADPSGATDSATVTITVNGLNDTPVLDDQDRSVAEDAENGDNVGVPLAFTDPDTTDTHTLEITGGDTGGAFAIDDSGQITVADATELDAGATPTYTLTVKVTDDAPTPASDTATITVTVTDVNRTPVAQSATPTVTEDTTTTVTLTATDADGDALSFDVPGTSTNGATIDNPGTLDCATTPKTCTRTYDYHPVADSNADDSFTFTVSDGTNTSAAATVSITITPVNDAPALDAGKSPTLGTVNEDAPAPVGAVGVLVSSLVDFAVPAGQVDNVTDVDSGAQLGIAVYVYDVAQGDLYYSLNGGTTWDLSLTRTRTNALLLAADGDNRVYYRPKANVNGTITQAIGIRAWDRTSGDDGDTGVTVNGGSPSGAFSTAEDNVPLTVTAVNDAPTITTTAGGITYDVGSTAVVIDSGLTIVDVDDTDLEGAVVAITSGFAKPEDRLDAPGPLPGGITASYSDATGELTLSGTASVADYQAALRRVTFSNLDLATTTGPRTITFTATDGSTPSAGATRSITVQLANAAPVAAAQTLSTSSGIRVTIGSGATGKLLRGASDGNDPVSDLRVSSTFTNVLPAGSVVTLIDAATGTYSFDPPGGYTGSGSFDYEICDDGIPSAPVKCDTATVTVTIGGTDLWFVDDSAAPGGDGRLTAPLQTLSLDAERGFGDRIFVFSGTYASGVGLLNDERLIGQGSTGVFDTLLGVSVPADGTLDARPTLSGTPPTVGGMVVLSTNTMVRGVAISSGASPGLLDANPSAITGVDVSETSVRTTTGTALSLTDVGGTISLTDLDTTGGSTAIGLVGVSAAITIGSGATISNTSAAAIDISGGTGAFTYNGTINVGAGRALRVVNRSTGTVGTVTLGGAITATGGLGILLDNNDNGTIAFTGGMELSTGANTAFAATGGGTVTSTGTNTLTTTTGTALRVANTTIGAAGLTFRSISSNGATNGIVLDTTGSSGGLTVTGNSSGSCGGSVGTGAPAVPGTANGAISADCTGGTIQGSTGAGILLRNTSDVSLTRMWVRTSGDDGIQGTNVTDFSLVSSFLDANGNAAGEHNIDFGDSTSATPDGLHGVGAITSSTIQNGFEDNVSVRNGSGAPLTGFAINGSQFRLTPSNTSADDNVFIEALGTASMTASATGSYFASPLGDQFGAYATGGGSLTISFTTNTLVGGHSTPFGGGIVIAANGAVPGSTGDVVYDVNGNNIQGATGTAISVLLGISTSDVSFSGRVRSNIIGTFGNAGSCSASGYGIRVQADGNGRHIASVTDNSMSACALGGVRAAAGDGAGQFDLTVTGNVLNPGAGVAFLGTFGQQAVNTYGNADSNAVCLNLGGAALAANTLIGTSGTGDFTLQKRFGAIVRLPGYAGSTAQDSAAMTAVVNFVLGRNGTAFGGAASATGTGGGYTGGAACSTP